MPFLSPNALVQGRYRVERLIGQGGMGAVYEATDLRLKIAVALKQTLLGDVQFNAAFEREAQMLASLRHPALPRVMDHFADAGGQFLVMEFIPGDDLAMLLARQGGPFPLDDVLAWADQLLRVLEYLHNRPLIILHRDIKPQNLKLTDENQMVLLDFGLAKSSSSHTRVNGVGTIFGYTPQYAPLEQIQGTGSDPRSDLYSLAATLHHLLVGHSPEDVLTRAAAVLMGQPDPLRAAHQVNVRVTAAVGEVLRTAMALNPSERPVSAKTLREQLAVARQLAAAWHPAAVPRSVVTVAPSLAERAPNGQPRASALPRIVSGAALGATIVIPSPKAQNPAMATASNTATVSSAAQPTTPTEPSDTLEEAATQAIFTQVESSQALDGQGGAIVFFVLFLSPIIFFIIIICINSLFM